MTHYFPTRRYSDLDRHGGHLRHELREPAWHGNHLGLPRGPGCHGIRMRRALLAIPVARLAPAFQAKCARHARGPQGGVRRVLVGATPLRRNGSPSYVLGPDLPFFRLGPSLASAAAPFFPSPLTGLSPAL